MRTGKPIERKRMYELRIIRQMIFIRESEGLSCAEVSRRLGQPPAMCSAIESGERALNLTYLLDFMLEFGVDLETMLEEVE